MSSSDWIDKRPDIYAQLSFSSSLPFDELAIDLSDKLFSGTRFSGKDLNAYEGIDSAFIRVLGLRIVLRDYTAENEFFLGCSWDSNFSEPEIDLGDIVSLQTNAKAVMKEYEKRVERVNYSKTLKILLEQCGYDNVECINIDTSGFGFD